MTRLRIPPTIQQCLAFAASALSRPPAHARIVRADPVGSCVWRCVLPLELCPPLNRFAEMASWKRREIKTKALGTMLAQHGRRRRPSPLPGRPLVRAMRFSSVEVDEHNGWTKVPVDRLTGRHGGLNFLVDDKPACVDLKPWWEPAPPGAGFCLIEVWS